MEIVPLAPIKDRVIGDLCFTGSLRVFPDGSREATIQKGYWGGVRPDLGRSPWAEQCRINKARAKKAAGGMDADNAKRAARRARRMVRWLVRCMGGDHLLTLTYRENMVDKERLKKDWRRFVRLVHDRYPNWRFVACIENQKRGAWHVHAAVKGFQPIRFLRAMWYKVVGDAMGQINIRAPWRRGAPAVGKSWTASNLAGYLSKYIGKTFEDDEFEGQRYWRSNGIKVPPPVAIHADYDTWEDAIVGVYNLVAEGVAVGVTQWSDSWGLCYWIYSPRPPEVPF